MDVNNKLLPKTHKSFRFGTGSVLTLTDDQINRIPYLAAIASSADFFEAARDDQGCFRLHPKIDLKQIRFILDWSPFSSIRDIFIRLPEDYDPVSTIALMDYLGLLDVPDPTLDDVDDSFFDIIVYKPLNNSYVERLRPLQMCDMAVRFAIALMREAYDVTDDRVHNRIYWYVMFILSAHGIFGSNIRYHMYKVAEHYFCLFKPSLIERLGRLRNTQYRYAKNNTWKNESRFINSVEEEDRGLISLIDIHVSKQRSLSYMSTRDYYGFSWDWFLVWDDFEDYGFSRRRENHTEKHLEPIYQALLEIIYDRVQNQLCERVRDDIRESPFSSQYLVEPKKDYYLISRFGFLWNSFYDLDGVGDAKMKRIARHIVEKQNIYDLFAAELATEEIRHLILNGLSHLKPTLEQKHRKLVEELQIIQANQEAANADDTVYISLRENHVSPFIFQKKQEETLSLELLLEKFNRPSEIIQEICDHLIEKLSDAAKSQIIGWLNNTYTAFEVGKSIAECISEDFDRLLSKTSRRDHQKPLYKPIPSRQPNYSRHRFR